MKKMIYTLYDIFKNKRKDIMKIENKSLRDEQLSKLVDWENTFNIAVEFHYPYEVLERIANARNEIHASNILHDARLNYL